MKKIFASLVLCSAFFLCTHAQSADEIKQINDQVWKPFIASFNSGDDEGFQAVHSKDVTRVTQDSKQIIDYEQYFKKVPDSIKAKWAAWKRNIELRFVQRITDGNRAFEVGYYKTTSTNSQTGEVRTAIGKFHVLLRRENTVWKILMDADTAEGASEEAFLKAAPVE